MASRQQMELRELRRKTRQEGLSKPDEPAKLTVRTADGKEKTRSVRASMPVILAGGGSPEDARDAERWQGLLTTPERHFLRYVARGYDMGDAAVLVGREPGEGQDMLQGLLSVRAGEAYMRACYQQLVSGELVGLSLHALKDVLIEGDHRSKVAAARTVLEAGAFFGKRADETVAALRSAGADPTLMGPEELEAAARATRQEAAQLRELLEAARTAQRQVVVESEAEELEAPPPAPANPWD